MTLVSLCRPADLVGSDSYQGYWQAVESCAKSKSPGVEELPDPDPRFRLSCAPQCKASASNSSRPGRVTFRRGKQRLPEVEQSHAQPHGERGVGICLGARHVAGRADKGQ